MTTFTFIAQHYYQTQASPPPLCAMTVTTTITTTTTFSAVQLFLQMVLPPSVGKEKTKRRKE
jgi:hypothetical protein